MKIQCPAKINLDLKITSKREDGFHNLESVMQTISLYDYLTLETSPSEEQRERMFEAIVKDLKFQKAMEGRK